MLRSARPLLRRLAQAIVPLAALACAPLAHAAQDYPSKPVHLMVGFAPGTTTDIVARTVADALRERFSQPFVVDNRPGANGMLAAEAVARAEPDGHTILITNTSAITLNPLVYKDIRYDVAKDYVPVTTVISVPAVLLVSANNERTRSVKTLADLIAAGKSGPPLTYASSGNGNLFHLAGAELSNQAGFQSLHVPYRAAHMRTALISGEVDFSFDTLAAMPQIEAGMLRPLGVTADKRWPQLPEVPTMQEQGFPDLTYALWTGVLVPAGTPAAIVETLHQAIREATAVPSIRDRLTVHGEIYTLDPDTFARTIRSELARNEAVVARAGISPN